MKRSFGTVLFLLLSLTLCTAFSGAEGEALSLEDISQEALSQEMLFQEDSSREVLSQESAFQEAFEILEELDRELVLSCGNYTFYLTPTDWLSDGDQVFAFLGDLYREQENMLEELRQKAPEKMEVIGQRAAKPLSFYFCDSTSGTSSFAVNDKLYLSGSGDVYHELVHIWLWSHSTDLDWLEEGLAELLSLNCENRFEAWRADRFCKMLHKEGMY